MADYITTCSCQANQVCSICQPPEFTLEQRTAMSHAFRAGNYANAYKGGSLHKAWLKHLQESDGGAARYSDHAHAAFALGWYSSHALHEIIGPDRRVFDLAYHSPAGRYVVHVARYTDDRTDEYAAKEDK